MSKTQHHSQDELRNMFGEDMVGKINRIAEIEKANKAAGKTPKAEKEVEIPEIIVQSGDCFSPRSTIARIVFYMKEAKVNKMAKILANGRTFGLENLGERVWRFDDGFRRAHGKKADMVIAAAEAACAAYRGESRR